MSSTQHANSERHYLLLTVAVIIGIVGVYLRFAGDAPIFNILSNIILVLGVIVALKAVFDIME
jgi:preprotein translocase subunit SecD